MSHNNTRDGERREERALIAFVTTELLGKGRNITITATTPLFEDRLVDSMNILRLIGYIEAKRGRRLDDNEIVMAKFRTVRAMARFFFQ